MSGTQVLLNGVDFILFSTSVDSRINGVSLNTSSFATTGSNTFKGQQTLSDNDLLNQITLDDYSGSLVLFGKSFSSSSTSLNHISASAGATSSNLIFKNSDSTGRLEVS